MNHSADTVLRLGLGLLLLAVVGHAPSASAEMYVGKVKVLDNAKRVIVVELDHQTSKEFHFAQERDVADAQVGAHVVIEVTGDQVTQLRSLSSPPPGSTTRHGPLQ